MKLLKELIVLLIESPSFKLIVIESSLFLGGWGAVHLFKENQLMQRHLGWEWARHQGQEDEDFCHGLDDVKYPWYIENKIHDLSTK